MGINSTARVTKIRRFSSEYLGKCRALCTENPIDSVFISRALDSLESVPRSFDLLVCEESRRFLAWEKRITGLFLNEVNMVPLLLNPNQIEIVSATLRENSRPAYSSIVGVQEQVLGIWNDLKSSWGKPRVIREAQPVLYMDAIAAESFSLETSLPFRRAKLADWEAVFPSAVMMFREEVGYDPTVSGDGYAKQVRFLCSTGRTWLLYDTDIPVKWWHKYAPTVGKVIFKTDIGVLSGGVAQLQGVWVDPDYRGLGLAKYGLKIVINEILNSLAPVVSLYVNDFNQVAFSLYKSLGMKQGSCWATVVL